MSSVEQGRGREGRGDHTGGSSRPVRKWEVFPGRSKFCCDGRVVMASQPGIFYFTLGLTIIPSICFFAIDGVYYFREGGGFEVVPFVALALGIFVVSTLLRTGLSDPGILPRSLPAEAEALDAKIEEEHAKQMKNGAPYRPAPRVQEIFHNGYTLKLKYCYTCKMFRPPRASHCSACDNCVDRFDHHCPWVGNCVGRRNYKYFYMFLVSTSIYCVYIFSFSIYAVVRRTFTMEFAEAMKDGPLSILIALVCFFALWSTAGLAGFHTYLTCHNMTTNEDIKGSFKRSRQSEGGNPFSEGSGLGNCASILCGPVPPSLIDARSFVSDIDIEDYKQRKSAIAAHSQGQSQGQTRSSNYPTQPLPPIGGYGTTATSGNQPGPPQGQSELTSVADPPTSPGLESVSGASETASDSTPMLTTAASTPRYSEGSVAAGSADSRLSHTSDGISPPNLAPYPENHYNSIAV